MTTASEWAKEREQMADKIIDEVCYFGNPREKQRAVIGAALDAARALGREEAAKGSLLRPPGLKPAVCYCPPNKCMAPRPGWCVGRRAAEAQTAPPAVEAKEKTK